MNSSVCDRSLTVSVVVLGLEGQVLGLGIGFDGQVLDLDFGVKSSALAFRSSPWL